MAKLKKRVHKKKAVIKKRVHRTNNHNQSHNAKTSEQQSRDNEMLKVMLGRPQQVIPGQVQQNDKLQQQIDTANKALNDIIQDNNSLKDQYRRIKEQQQEHLRERRQTTADIRTEEKMLDDRDLVFSQIWHRKKGILPKFQPKGIRDWLEPWFLYHVSYSSNDVGY